MSAITAYCGPGSAAEEALRLLERAAAGGYGAAALMAGGEHGMPACRAACSIDQLREQFPKDLLAGARTAVAAACWDRADEDENMRKEASSRLIPPMLTLLTSSFYFSSLTALINRQPFSIEPSDVAARAMIGFSGNITIMRGSLLLLAAREGDEIFVSSDAPSLLSRSHRIQILEPGDILEAAQGFFSIRNGREIVERSCRTIRLQGITPDLHRSASPVRG